MKERNNRYFSDLERAVTAPTLEDLEEAGQAAGAAADFTWALNVSGFDDPRTESGIAGVCNIVFDLVHTIVTKYAENQRAAE